MKVVAFNGSPKKEGNTYHAIKMVAQELEKEGIDVEIIHVGNKVIRGCLACNGCAKNQNEKCVINDEVNDWIQKMKEADGIILGSPVHYSAIGGTMKSFLDRAFYVASANKSMLRYKVGASVVAVRRSGGIPTFEQLNNYINYSEMLMPTSNYWNVIHGTAPGEVNEDKEGTQIMSMLGKNMAWLMKLVQETRKEEGCIKYEVYQDEKDLSILTMVEEWESREKLDEHIESKHFQRIVPMLGKLMVKETDMNVYNKLL